VWVEMFCGEAQDAEAEARARARYQHYVRIGLSRHLLPLFPSWASRNAPLLASLAYGHIPTAPSFIGLL
jgi:hypothetical protein